MQLQLGLGYRSIFCYRQGVPLFSTFVRIESLNTRLQNLATSKRPRTPVSRTPPTKIALRKRAKSSITQPWITRFRSIFVQSLNAWQPKCCKSSRSKGQRSRSQRDITCAKIRKFINNAARACSFSLKFRTEFDHVTLDVPGTFKVNGSKVTVTAWHNVSA